MAPASKKGTKKSTRDRPPSSRQSTPLSAADTAPPTPQTATPASVAPTSAGGMPKETAYIHTSTAALVSNDASIDALIEKAYSGAKAGDTPPSARELHSLHSRIKDTVNKFMVRRGEVCDRSMRQLAQKRKERVAIEREQEVAREEHAARVKREREEDSEREKRKGKKDKEKNGKKRSAEEMMVEGEEEEEERKELRDVLPSVGAHGVARQDGVGVNQGVPAPPSPVISPRRPSLDLMDVAHSPSSASDETSPTSPPSTAPLYERAFGKDPTQFDDPTIYDIRPLNPDMTMEEKKDILNVAYWPESDLADLTAGEPPDCDFSNAKPANQVNFSTFQTYVEPYIRPFTEEDVAFLKERGDRLTPYLIPQRGTRGYKEVWAAEDGMDGVAPPRKIEADPNEARGSMEEMNDDTAETDEVSLGPIMNRLLSIIRPTPSTSKKQQEAAEDADGDTTMLNTSSGDLDTQPDAVSGASSLEEQKPLTALPPDAPRPLNLPTPDYATLDTRALLELRHLGFLTPPPTTTTNNTNNAAGGSTPDFSSHQDDEVAARLRTLQHELRRLARANNVRKARVLELAEERMAMQEYAGIAEDLDGQVNAAYLKRNRSLAKPGGSKKGGAAAARVGGAAGQKGLAVGGGGRGVSDGVRALMQKRRDWIEMVGPVVAFGRPPIPGDEETVFDELALRRLEKVEREAEAGDGEGEAD